MNASELGALISGVALLIGAVFTGLVSLKNASHTVHGRDQERLEQYERWRPKIRRLVAELRDLLADHRIPEPPGIDETMRFPPKDDEVKTDD